MNNDSHTIWIDSASGIKEMKKKMVLSKKNSTIRTGCCRAHAKYLQTTGVKTIWVCVYNALWCALRWGILCVNFWTQQHVEQQWCNGFSVVTFIIWALCNAHATMRARTEWPPLDLSQKTCSNTYVSEWDSNKKFEKFP